MASLGRARSRARGGAGRPFLLLLALSLLLLALRDTDWVRATSSLATAVLVPAQRVLADAGLAANRFVTAVGEIERLRADNARLRDENDRLLLENVRLGEQAVAAQQATRLDGLRRTLPYETLAASVIARDPSGVVRSIVIGAGSGAGVVPGHAVLSDQGLVGRVTEVGASYAKVLLITDSASAVSALVQGSRATGIVRGQYGDALVMEWILQSESVVPGDIVLTAGLALGNELRSLYPKGLVIGRVIEVARAQNAAYQRAVIQPAVDLRTLEHVLVVKTAP